MNSLLFNSTAIPVQHKNTFLIYLIEMIYLKTFNPGLVVMGDDSCSKGHGFKSRRRIPDGHFFTLMICNNCVG